MNRRLVYALGLTAVILVVAVFWREFLLWALGAAAAFIGWLELRLDGAPTTSLRAGPPVRQPPPVRELHDIDDQVAEAEGAATLPPDRAAEAEALAEWADGGRRP